MVLWLPMEVISQDFDFGTGLLPDDGTYDLQPRKAQLITRDYTILPQKYSLKKYCPKVKSQAQYGTCTSWATAYAARTIAEAISKGWDSQEHITREAFSPIFVYAQIKSPGDYNCKKGSRISDAMSLLKSRGVSKYNQFNVLCADRVSNDLLASAALHKIDNYFTLFSINCKSYQEKINKTKKAICEDCPVVIAMHLPLSFHNAGNVWSGTDVDPSKHGYHAMCVIGYDDNMMGGAFEVMNSWGEGWGNHGFVWVRYSDYHKYVDQAYEMYVKKEIPFPRPEPQPDPRPQPQPVPKPTPKYKMSGEIEFILSTGEKMSPILQSGNDLSSYTIAGDYISGTRYRIYITNNEPAYVYVIGSDLKNNVCKVFPPDNTISPALTYKHSHIAIPDEKWFVEMDDNVGTDYMCVLYSAKELDIQAVISSIKTGTGNFNEKVKRALGDKMVPTPSIQFGDKTVSFQTETNHTIVPLIVSLSHK